MLQTPRFLGCKRRLTSIHAIRSLTSSTNPREGIVTIALNNPKRRNALSSTVLEHLKQQLAQAKEKASTKVLIIKALDDPSQYNGVFCSGHDLKELTQRDNETKGAYQERMQQLFSLCSSVMTDLAAFPVPTIAEVDGIATAAGCQLVASCDLALASSASRFATPGVHIGLFCSTPAVPLVRTIGKKHAMEMLLTGDLISAERAYQMGLINRVIHPPESVEDSKVQLMLSKLLQEETMTLATSIAQKSKGCICTGLQTLRSQQSLSLEDAYKVAERTMVENLASKDAVEGIDAFLTKRKPNWS